MCELFISLILSILMVSGVATTIWYVVATIKERSKLGYQPTVQYDANTGKLKMRNPPRKLK